jgi:hypothetical protein
LARNPLRRPPEGADGKAEISRRILGYGLDAPVMRVIKSARQHPPNSFSPKMIPILHKAGTLLMALAFVLVSDCQGVEVSVPGSQQPVAAGPDAVASPLVLKPSSSAAQPALSQTTVAVDSSVVIAPTSGRASNTPVPEAGAAAMVAALGFLLMLRRRTA